MKRRTLLLATGSLAAASAHVHAQPYPARPITVLVGFPPGGAVDMTTRAVSALLAKELGQPIVIDNRAGAGGVIAYEAAAKARPDGYTLVAIANGSFLMGPRLVGRKNIGVNDFAPIGMMSESAMVLEVPAKSRFGSLKDLLAHARQNPGRLSIGILGQGTTNHVGVVALAQAAEVQFNLIPYKGATPAVTDLLGGQIDALVDQVAGSISHIRAGTLRPLAVTTQERSPDLPNTPTMAESGLPHYEVSTTNGLLAPAGTPAEIVKTLNTALNKVLLNPAIAAQIRAMGSVPKPLSVAAFRQYLQTEDEKAEALVKTGQLRVE